MSRREDMERILNAESERWSSMSSEQLIAELRELQAYQVEDGNQKYGCHSERSEESPHFLAPRTSP
jgi:hypothetical protein